MIMNFNISATQPRPVSRLNEYLNTLDLPEHSFGLLETVLEKLAKLQNQTDVELSSLQHLVFCSDHGVYERTHHATASRLTTADHVQRLLNGHTPIARMCTIQQVDLTVIDCGLNATELLPHGLLVNEKIAHGTRDFFATAAMTEEQLQRAVSIGAQQASLKMAEGAKVLSFGALGLGSTTSAAAISMALLPLSPEIAITNQNHTDTMLNRFKTDVLIQALELHRDQLDNAWKVVQHMGGFEIAAIMGAVATAAELGGLCLIDGYACAAAILALHRVYPNITDYVQFTNQSSHLGQQAIIKHLGQNALLNLNLGLGEGTGSILAWPLIESSVQCIQSLNPQQ